jgi:hypothetical protein
MPLLVLALILSQSDASPAAAEAPPPPADEKAADDAAKGSEPMKEEVQKATEEPPPAPLAPNPWTATGSAGFTWITGNVITMTVVFNGQATRKTDQTIFIVKVFGGYGEKYGPLPREVLVMNAGITAQFDYRFTKTISLLVGAGLDTDHVKSVEIRGYGDLGMGFTWVDIKGGTEKEKDLQKVLVKTDLSLRVQPERRYQYFPTPTDVPDVFLLGPRLAQVLHYAFSSTTYVREEIEFLPNVLSPQRFMLNSVTKAAVGLISVVSASASFTARYDSAPAPGRLPLDTILTIGLEANL